MILIRFIRLVASWSLFPLWPLAFVPAAVFGALSEILLGAADQVEYLIKKVEP